MLLKSFFENINHRTVPIFKNINNISVLTIQFILVLFLPCGSLFAQSLVQDTLIVSFAKPDSINPIPVAIGSVVDNREEHQCLIGRYEKNNYFFIPVDLLICTDKPLNDKVSESLYVTTIEESKVHLNLVIDEFNVTKKTNSIIYSHYLLNASIQLYVRNDWGFPEYLGQLLYENTSKKPMFRDKLKTGFESVIKKWQYELNRDLDHISKSVSIEHLSTLDNYRSEVYNGKRTNIFGGIDFVMFNDGWMSNNEIYFSHREAKKKFIRSGYSIRYRNTDTFSSIEYGLTDDNIMNRLSDRWVFRAKQQLYFGLNRWDDISNTEHEIYDAFIVDASMSQSLLFNPFDRKSAVLGVGIVENLYYIHSRGFNLQLGLSVHVGIKL